LKKTRRRYLALQLDSGEMFTSTELLEAIWAAVLRLYGEYGASQTDLVLINYNAEKKLATIHVSHTAVDMIRTALASVTRINNKPVALRVIRVSGTIKTLHRKIEHQCK